MTKAEYKEFFTELEKEFERRKDLLNRGYALANNKVEIGDVISDHQRSIKVGGVSMGQPMEGLPCCVYYGPELKKDKTPKKGGLIGQVWQTKIQHHEKGKS